MSQVQPKPQAGQECLIALGGNVASPWGNPAETVRIAAEKIAERLHATPQLSRIWRTPAFPAGAGPDYANAALRLLTPLPPQEILHHLHEIEAEAQRERRIRWGARTLDLDLIAVGAEVLPNAAGQSHWRDLMSQDQEKLSPEELILPHPRLQDRAFVLVPLAEVAPLWRHPLLDQTVTEMLARQPLEDVAAVTVWTEDAAEDR